MVFNIIMGTVQDPVVDIFIEAPAAAMVFVPLTPVPNLVLDRRPQEHTSGFV